MLWTQLQIYSEKGKEKKKVLGNQMRPYELISHLHLEEDDINIRFSKACQFDLGENSVLDFGLYYCNCM